MFKKKKDKGGRTQVNDLEGNTITWSLERFPTYFSYNSNRVFGPNPPVHSNLITLGTRESHFL